jgi:hypothetical protein
MDEEFRKERSRTLRAMADKADPFTKKRLLDLAERYEERPRPVTPLPKIANEPAEEDTG